MCFKLGIMDTSKPLFRWTLVGTFVFLGLLVYGNSLGNNFVRWDDGLLIYENPAIRGFSLENLKTIFSSYDPELYIPLTLLSYQFDFVISGTNAGFYHFHSLILHIINAILVVFLMLKLTKRQWIAIVTGLLFLLHPINTEAVAWASGRKDVLSGMFFLLTLIFYEGYKETGNAVRYRLSIGAFALGLLAKVTIITAPAIIVLIALLKKRRIDKAFFREMIPYAVLMILFAIIAFYGKTGVLDSSTRMEKILIAPMSTVFYLQKLLLPTGLAVIYPFVGDVILFSARIFIPIVVCFVLLAVGLRSFMRKRIVFFGLAFFLITLSPSLLNFSKGDFLYFASDRYAYLGSVGILFLIAYGLFVLRERYGQIIDGLTLGLAVVIGVFAIRQSMVWKTSETLFQHNIRLYPEAHTMHNNLGNIYRTRGEMDKAITSYKEALRLSEDFGRGSEALYGRSKILSNLASSYRTQGNNALALETLKQAKNLNPENKFAHMQEGIILGTQSNVAGAEAAYLRALEIDPAFTTAQINLGSLYINTGRPQEAVDILEDAIAKNPYYPQAYYNLAAAYKEVSRHHESLKAYEKAVELEPAFVAARINLGILYAERLKPDLAIEQFEAVLRYDPNNKRAQSALQQLNAR